MNLIRVTSWLFLSCSSVMAQNLSLKPQPKTPQVEIDFKHEALLVTYLNDELLGVEVLDPSQNTKQENASQNDLMFGFNESSFRMGYDDEKSQKSPKLFPKEKRLQWNEWDLVASFSSVYSFVQSEDNKRKYLVEAELSRRFSSGAMMFLRVRGNQEKIEDYQHQLYLGLGGGYAYKNKNGREKVFKTFIGYRIKSESPIFGGDSDSLTDDQRFGLDLNSRPEATIELTSKYGEKVYVTYGLSFAFNERDFESYWDNFRSDHIEAYIETRWKEDYLFRINYDHAIDQDEADMISFQFIRRF